MSCRVFFGAIEMFFAPRTPRPQRKHSLLSFFCGLGVPWREKSSAALRDALRKLCVCSESQRLSGEGQLQLWLPGTVLVQTLLAFGTNRVYNRETDEGVSPRSLTVAALLSAGAGCRAALWRDG